METPDKTKTCPPSIPTSLADFSPTMSSTCSTYHGCSGGGPPPLLGRFLALLNATPLRFNSNHFFSTLSTVRGTLPVALRASVVSAHTLACFWFVTVLECFDWNRSWLASAGENDDYHQLDTFTVCLNPCLEGVLPGQCWRN